MLDRIDIKYFKEAIGYINVGKESDVDISAKCPICSDHKQRLHLYTKGTVTNVNCFNGGCSVVNKTMYSFLRDFYPDLLPLYKRETFNNTIDNLRDSSFKDIIKIEKPIPVQTFDLSTYMLPITDEAIKYINTRGINYDESFGKWYFGNQDLKIGDITYKITNNIIIPLYYNNIMYGFYSRSIKNKDFITYMNPVNIGYKIWNWFNINLNEPVYIFEGIFDAISSGKKNIIALLGAKLPEDRLKEIKYPVFCLDNDKTGYYNSIDYANRGYNIFVQPVELKEKDMNELMLNHNINLSQLIDNNTYKGISAITRIKAKS